ncbi:Hypothetical predicted protein, partial [Paramuricea clavata]
TFQESCWFGGANFANKPKKKEKRMDHFDVRTAPDAIPRQLMRRRESTSSDFIQAGCDEFKLSSDNSPTDNFKKLIISLSVRGKSKNRKKQLNVSMEEYSYQFNVKIVGMPLKAEKESPETTANLCLQLFAALGVKDISLQDIDIAHRMPARRASSHPNSIICKFVWRLAKNKVMEARKEVSKLQAVQLGFSSGIPVEHVNIYDHLTPRLHTL